MQVELQLNDHYVNSTSFVEHLARECEADSDGTILLKQYGRGAATDVEFFRYFANQTGND